MSVTAAFKKTTEEYQEDASIIPTVDMHIHFVSFLQETDGAKKLLAEMDKGNIEKVVTFGLPVKKKWSYYEPHKPSYYLTDEARCYYWSATDEILAAEYLRLSADEQARIAPTICGFNPTDMAAIDYLEMMWEKYPFWKGVGEIIMRHDDLTSLTLEELSRSNHPAMDEVYKFCARKKVPICLHQNSTSVGSHEDFHYLHELEEVLEKHYDTQFVWAHCGVSRRVAHVDYFRMISGMLVHYNNLCVDMSWVVYDDIICPPRANKTDRLVPYPQWIDEVILPYSDRVMIGSDLVGHFGQLGATMARYNGLLEILPDDVAEKVARTNAINLWFREESK